MTVHDNTDTIICASPTCAVRERITRLAAPSHVKRWMRAKGWGLERHDGDDRARWYCPRCVL